MAGEDGTFQGGSTSLTFYAYDTEEERRPARELYGAFRRPVEAVDVVVGGATHEARMGENAFGVRLERTRGSSLERVVLRRRDGTANEIALALK